MVILHLMWCEVLSAFLGETFQGPGKARVNVIDRHGKTPRRRLSAEVSQRTPRAVTRAVCGHPGHGAGSRSVSVDVSKTVGQTVNSETLPACSGFVSS